MMHQDYLMRMITQFSRVMGVLMGLIRERKPEQAFIMIHDLYRLITGRDADEIHSLSEQQLLKLLLGGDRPDPERLLMVAQLLKEEGDVFVSLEDSTASYILHCKSLYLFLAAAKHHADTRLIEYPNEIEQLLQRLSMYVLPESILYELWPYFESRSFYSRAEDTLFELLEIVEQNPDRGEKQLAGLIQEGIQFYERLLVLSDTELEHGKLPRVEVLEAMAELAQYSGSNGEKN